MDDRTTKNKYRIAFVRYLWIASISTASKLFFHVFLNDNKLRSKIAREYFLTVFFWWGCHKEPQLQDYYHGRPTHEHNNICRHTN